MKSLTAPAAMAVLGLAAPLAVFAQEEVTLTTSDGVTIYADLYRHEGEQSRGTVLLFHQEAGNAKEYADIAPRLAAMGFEALAADLRKGGNMFMGTNRTMAGLSMPAMFNDDCMPDVQAALDWARTERPGEPIVLWGSSMSADHVIVLAADDPEGIAGVLAFSPLSLLLHSDEADAASRLTVPLFVSYATTPMDEGSNVAKVADAAPAELLTLYVPEIGAHGAVTVVEDHNPNGWEANWAAVEAFLDRVAP